MESADGRFFYIRLKISESIFYKGIMVHDRNLLEIELAELQIEMQEITSRYQTLVAVNYSLMVSVAVFSLGIAWTFNRLDFVLLGFVVISVTGGMVLILEIYFSRKMEDIKRRITRLKKEYSLRP